MVVDMELFQKAQKSLTHRSINKKNLGLGKLNPFSGRIFDKESGIPLKLYPHQRLKIRVFRLSYPKPAEISYERGNIPFEEVYQAVYEILVNENQTARKIAGMIGSQIWEEEKVKKIQKVKAVNTNLATNKTMFELVPPSKEGVKNSVGGYNGSQNVTLQGNGSTIYG